MGRSIFSRAAFYKTIAKKKRNLLHKQANKVDSEEKFAGKVKNSLNKKGKKQGKKQLSAAQKAKARQLYQLVKEENHHEEPLPAVLHATKRTFPRVLLDYVGFRIPVKISAPNYAIHDLDLRHNLRNCDVNGIDTFMYSYKIAKHFGQNLVHYILKSGTLEARTMTAETIAPWLNGLRKDHTILWDYKLRVLSKFKDVPFEPIVDKSKISQHLQNKMLKLLTPLLKEWKYYTTNFEYYITDANAKFKESELMNKKFTTLKKNGNVILEGQSEGPFYDNGIFLTHATKLFGDNVFTQISTKPSRMQEITCAFQVKDFCNALNRHHIIQYWRGVQMTVIKLMKIYHHILNLKPVFEQNIVAYRAMIVELVNSTDDTYAKKYTEELERMSTLYSEFHNNQSSEATGIKDVLLKLLVKENENNQIPVKLLFLSANSNCKKAHQQAEKTFIDCITNSKVKEVNTDRAENLRYARYKPLNKQSFVDSVLTYKNQDKYCVLVMEIYNAMEFPKNYTIPSISDEKKMWSYSRRIKVMTKVEEKDKNAQSYIALLTENNFLEFPVQLTNTDMTELLSADNQPRIPSHNLPIAPPTTTFQKLPDIDTVANPQILVYFDDKSTYDMYKDMYDKDEKIVDQSAKFQLPQTQQKDTPMKEGKNVRGIDEISQEQSE